MTLADVLQRVADDELKRLMVFMPPRHGKSELISRLFPAYYLYRHPERWTALAAYGADLAHTLSRNARDNYTRHGGVIKDDAAAVKQWETGRGGGLWACGIGGPATGKGFHVGICDDPIKSAEEANSPTYRAKHKDWWSSVWYTRCEPDAALIVVQTRWHVDDLAGWLLAEEAGDEPERWHIVSMEAIKEEVATEAEPRFPSTCTVEPDPREAGEALCPERYPLEKLAKIRARIKRWWGALFQQRPIRREGKQFSALGLPTHDAQGHAHVEPMGEGVERVRFYDLGGTDAKTGDFTVGVLMARTEDERYHVVDVVRGQWRAHERNATIRQIGERDRERYGHMKTVVEAGVGLAIEVTDAIVRKMAGLPIEIRRVRGKKETRADPFADQCQGGNVSVVSAPWNVEFIDELTAFPDPAMHDDQVDAASGAFAELAGATTFEIWV